jgi:hypothetical protein
MKFPGLIKGETLKCNETTEAERLGLETIPGRSFG